MPSAIMMQAVAMQARPAAAVPDLAQLLARIEEALDMETDGIRSDMSFDIAAANTRKGRYLYDLTRAMRGQDDEAVLAQHRPQIERLRDKLAINQRVIAAHMDAVGEVAALVNAALRDAETDGTYSQSAFAGYGN